jgi:hypothetical protein
MDGSSETFVEAMICARGDLSAWQALAQYTMCTLTLGLWQPVLITIEHESKFQQPAPPIIDRNNREDYQKKCKKLYRREPDLNRRRRT